jgi:serine phosphatase RsbU (regulator of sigma subunit)/ligand-binding sensor domain-containing protein
MTNDSCERSEPKFIVGVAKNLFFYYSIKELGVIVSKKGQIIIFIGLLLIGAVLTCLYAAADDFPAPSRLKFVRIGVQQGFQQGAVTSIFQDRKGFMWFGTYNGLVKYNGYDFTFYKYRHDDPNTPGHKYLSSIYQDRQGLLWIGTYETLDKFDPARETFTHYQISSGTSSSTGFRDVSAVLESLEEPGILWVGTGEGLGKLDKETNSFTLDRHFADYSQGLKTTHAHSLVESPPGILWIATNNGLFKYNLKKTIIRRYINEPDNSNSLSHNFISFIGQSRVEPGILWVCTQNGLDKFDPVKETFVHYRHNPQDPYSLSHNYIESIFESTMEEEKGLLWVATREGLNLLHPKSGKAVHYQNDPGDIYSLSNDRVLSVYQTPSGVIWVGTEGGGLCKVEERNKRFIHYHTRTGAKNVLSSDVVLSIHESSSAPGILWIGTNDGLNKFNTKTGKFTVYRNDANNPNSPGDNAIYVIYECPREPGILWLGTMKSGIDRFDPRENTFAHYKDSPKNPAAKNLTWVMVMHKSPLQPGVLWFGTLGGDLCQLMIETKTFTRYSLSADNPKNFYPVNCIYESATHPGILWVGTDGGLVKFNILSGQFTRYYQGSTGAELLSRDAIFSFYESPQEPGILWMATGKGLTRTDLKTGDSIEYKGSKSLEDFIIVRILEDDQGNFWLSTATSGLLKFNPHTGAKKRFDIGDGLQGNEFYQAACKRLGGEMFFGGLNGFTAFYPHQVKDNPYVPPVVLTDFQIFNRSIKPNEPGRKGHPILEKSITDTKFIQLSHKDKMFSFEFAALNYNRTERNQYAYKMEGFTDDWQNIGKRRMVTFTNLSPGTYTFKVKGSNNDGLWNEEGTSVQVIISPPWWLTLWAYGLYISLLALILVGLNRLQRARLIKKERDQAKIQEAQLRAKAAEAEARAIEAENKRKTHELEEARKLQLSMLPKKLPNPPGFDIKVFMKPAYEVGGDYYDFLETDDGTLTIAVGDATGHGLKAGTLVSIIKGLFLNEAGNLQPGIHAFFDKSNRIIKQMHLGNLFMGLTLVRIKHNRAVIASAGMPPIYLYSEKNRAIEEIVLKAPPIGAFYDFPYPYQEVELTKGDTLLLLSDGLPELFNPAMEMFGYSRLKKLFAGIGDKTPEQIIDELVAAGESWLEGKPQDDDMTFVVLKVK